MTRVFFDMDGTLAEYRPINEIEDLYEKGYFATLRPQEGVVNAAKRLFYDPNFEVYVLSAVLSDSEYSVPEKTEWLNQYFPIDDSHRIFSPVGEPKSLYIPNGIQKSDILLDDYTVNLNDWGQKACAVKILNGLNHTKGTWTGNKLSAFRDGKSLADAIVRISHGERIQDGNPATVLAIKEQRRQLSARRNNIER